MVLVVPVLPQIPDSSGPQRELTASRSGRSISSNVRRINGLRLQGETGSVVVHLDPPVFAACWALLFLARCACFAYCIGAAYAMLVLHHPYMGYYAELLRPGIQPLLQPTACLYALVALAHALQLVRMVLHLLRPPADTRTASVRRSTVSYWLVDRTWTPLFSRRGFFGVESRYYQARYAVRETIEIVSQSIQAYTSSVLIGQPWINNVYIAIVLINCTSTMLIQRITTTRNWSLAKERLACVVVDTVLDAGTAIILPVILVYPYARAIDLDLYSFDLERVYDDVWFIALINENRQIFPLSLVDLGFKFFPHVSLFVSIGSIASILRRRSTQQPVKQPSVRKVDAKTKATSTLHVAFVFWGLALLLCHLVATWLPHANDHHEMDGCKQQLRPWFVAKSACTVYEFNCHRRQLPSMDEDTGSLDFLDTTSLAVLIASHCPALRVLSGIRTFPNLIGFEIYNSTLVQWSSDAALTSTTHPTITFVFIIRTNLTGIPPGLLHAHLPPTLMDIEFSTTNLSSVPSDLHVTWAHVTSLYIEHSHLQTVPDTLWRLNAYDMSLIGNGITQIPDAPITHDNLVMLAMAVNPIQTLPPSMAETLARVGYLNLIDTAIAVLPDWLEDSAGVSSRLFLAGTPYCNAKSAVEIAQRFGDDARISCTFADSRARSRYPLELTARFFVP